jgi:hypothetical protein
MGGGAPLPVYQGVEFRSSRILLSGPPIETRSDQQVGNESEGLGGMVERLSRRLSLTAQEVMRRFSYFSGSGPTTPTTARSLDRTIEISTSDGNGENSEGGEGSNLGVVDEEKLKVPHPPPSPGSSPSTPVRLAYHASVILETAAIEEEKSLEKEEGSNHKGKGKVEHKVEIGSGGEYKRKSWWQLSGSGIGSSSNSNSNRIRNNSLSSFHNSESKIPNTINPIKRFSQISIPINSSSIIIEIPEESSQEGHETSEIYSTSSSTATLNLTNSPKADTKMGSQQQQSHRRRTSSIVVLETVKEGNELRRS